MIVITALSAASTSAKSDDAKARFHIDTRKALERADADCCLFFFIFISVPPLRELRGAELGGRDLAVHFAEFRISSSCVPMPTVSPRSSTMILSAWRMVLMRCATMIFVVSCSCLDQPLAQLRIRAVVQSAENESSKTRISGFLASARAMERRCFWPPDMLRPICAIMVLRAVGELVDKLLRLRKLDGAAQGPRCRFRRVALAKVVRCRGSLPAKSTAFCVT